MAGTAFSSLIGSVRATNLIETTARYWTDAELVTILGDGCNDLWRRIADLFDEHFTVIDETNVSLAANATSLTGVPADCYRVVSIEPRVLGQSNPNTGLVFKNRKWNQEDFVVARAATPIDPQNNVIYYKLFGAGAPLAAPIIRVGPSVTSAVPLTMVYVQTLPVAGYSAATTNPIPGAADNALKAWLTAYAKAKERDDGAPDPEWLAIYGTEKTNLVQQLAQRETQEPQYVEAFFQDAWQDQ